MTDNKCAVKRCRGQSEMFYYGRPICWKHWVEHCNERSKFDLKVQLRIKGRKKNEPWEVKHKTEPADGGENVVSAPAAAGLPSGDDGDSSDGKDLKRWLKSISTKLTDR